MDKNVNAIDKIIAELSMKCYESANRRTAGRVTSYTLSAECLEAIEIKHDYLDGKITEAEYKDYCLKYNLRTSIKANRTTDLKLTISARRGESEERKCSS